MGVVCESVVAAGASRWCRCWAAGVRWCGRAYRDCMQHAMQRDAASGGRRKGTDYSTSSRGAPWEAAQRRPHSFFVFGD